jgi:hypothetical protein
MCIELAASGSTMLSPAEARRLAGQLLHLANRTEPLDPESFRVLVEPAGTTLEDLAEVAEVELPTATKADSLRLARALGRKLTGSDDASVSIEAQR